MKMVKLLKVTGFVVGGLAGLVALAVATVYGLTQRRLTRSHAVRAMAVPIPTDSAAWERGRHLVVTRGCADCHGTDYAGRMVIDDPAVGRVAGPNLTRGRGGLPADYSDEDYVRALRHGVARDGRALFLMPSLEYTGLSDEDLGAMVAYLKTLLPVDRERGPVSPGPVARVLLLNGQMKLAAEHIDHGAVRPSTVVAAITPEYGRYLAASCVGCHGDNLAGGPIPGAPPDWPLASNLTPQAGNPISTWDEAAFMAVLRTGKRPDGTALSPIMPAAFGQMTDAELQALWAYLRTLPAAGGAAKAN